MRNALIPVVSPSPRVASRWRALLVAAAAGLAVLALSASGGGSSSSSTKTSSRSTPGSTASSGAGTVVSGPGGTVKIRSSDDVDTFDPAKTGAENMSVQALELAYDRLLYQSPDGKLEPYLANSWTTHARLGDVHASVKGATCADGTPMTPKVVADSLRYSFSQKTARARNLGYAAGGGGAKSVTSTTRPRHVTITLNASPTTRCVRARPRRTRRRSSATPGWSTRAA